MLRVVAAPRPARAPDREGRTALESVELLVTRAQAGDRDAFGALYDMRIDAIGRYVGAILRDVHRVEDVVAQTFMLAWKDLPALRKVERFDAWLFRIAHNQAMRELNRRPTVPLDDAPEIADPRRAGLPGPLLDEKERAEHVRGAVLQLPAAQRDVLILRFLQDLSYTEVARKLGKKEEAVRALNYRGLRREMDRE